MGYNGSGTFLINTSGQPVVTGTTISSTVFNALTADLATGLSTCILKDGTQATTARIPFIFGINSSLTTDSTSTGTGSIITAGGIGITKALWVGGLANIAGAVTMQSTAESTTYLSTTGRVYLGGQTSSDVQLVKGGTGVAQFKLGDDSTVTGCSGSYFLATSAIYVGGLTSSEVGFFRSGQIMLTKLADFSAFCEHQAAVFSANSSIIHLGDQSATAVSLRRSGTTLLVRKGNDSGDAGITCGNLTTTGTVSIGGGASGTFSNSVTVTNGIVIGGS